MATEHPSSALRAPASSRPYARANPGYGKRSVPDQRPPRSDDFVLLPERERHIAGYVDRLPDGAAMDIKSLAKDLPPYGQMAVGSALRALGVAGHLRHVRCLAAVGDGQVRWVTRTYWSRTARDNEWWNARLQAEGNPEPPAPLTIPAPSAAAPVPGPAAAPVVPQQRPPAPVPGEVSAPVPAAASAPVPGEVSAPVPAAASAPVPASVPQGHSPAYLALARLGRVDSRLALSAGDCAALEELAAAWLARGVDGEYLVRTLAAGLPAAVDSPVGFVRRRLRDKIPPRLPTAPTPGEPVRRLMVECTQCGAPGRPEALPDGLCRSCRSTAPDTGADAATEPAAEPAAERDVTAYVGTLRELLRLP
ncbi:MarR family transcriptional regulator [Streptomyces sp. NPDC060022]|uniref:MarR family transcriptional regulator n=1 Tax=Streptomyces sp. NPDC060022 TaxID=3347039 RepID=UPI0036B2E36E